MFHCLGPHSFPPPPPSLPPDGSPATLSTELQAYDPKPVNFTANTLGREVVAPGVVGQEVEAPD